MSKKPKTIEICDIYRDIGDTFPERIYAWSINDKAVIVITDYVFTLVVMETEDALPGSSEEIFVLSGVIVSESDGQVEFSPNTGEAAMELDAWYDIRVTYPNGKIRTIRKGRYIID